MCNDECINFNDDDQEVDAKFMGQRLKTIRLLRGYGQQDVAKALGVTFQQIQKYENGKNNIKSTRLYELSKFLKVPVSLFFPLRDDYELLSLTQNQIKLAKLIKDLSPYRQETFYALAKNVKEAMNN